MSININFQIKMVYIIEIETFGGDPLRREDIRIHVYHLG